MSAHLQSAARAAEAIPSAHRANRAVCKYCDKTATPIDGDDLLDVKVCARCCAGLGGQCHTPGCALWMHNVQDLPIMAAPSQEGEGS